MAEFSTQFKHLKVKKLSQLVLPVAHHCQVAGDTSVLLVKICQSVLEDLPVGDEEKYNFINNYVSVQGDTFLH